MIAKSAEAPKEPLLDQIKTFRKWRNWVAVPLIMVGAASIVLPVLPGLLILFLGLLLINPGLADKIREKLMLHFHRYFSTENS